MQKLFGLSLVALMVATSITGVAVRADDISPGIRDEGKVYSKAKPDPSMYGTGSGAREAEASALRFQIQNELDDGDWDLAVKHAKTCVQFDPADPGSHLLLARALTKKFYTKKGSPDEKLLLECLYEWTLLWHHDADQGEQIEAKTEAKRLLRVEKEIRKKHDEELAARIKAKEQLAQDRRENSGKIASRPGGEADGADAKPGTKSDGAKSGSTKADTFKTAGGKTGGAKPDTTATRTAGHGAKSVTTTDAEDKSGNASSKDDSEESTDSSTVMPRARKKRFGLF